MAGTENDNKVAQNGSAVIYIAEDDPLLLELAELLLKYEGYSCRTFFSAESALQAFQDASSKPRLVISDYSMGLGAMNGLDFLVECKRLAADVKTFLVSGTVDEAVLSRTGQCVDRFLSKPYKTSEFISAVRELLGFCTPPVKEDRRLACPPFDSGAGLF